MRSLVAVCLVTAVCGGCGRAPGASAPKPAAAVSENEPLVHASCARRTEGVRPARVSSARQGSAVALARSEGLLLAYIADADSRSVHTVSVDDGRELVRTRVGGAPRQLVVLSDGRVVATLSDGTRIAVLEPAADPAKPLSVVCLRDVPAEPWGIALSRDETKLVVTSAWGAALTVFDASSLAAQRVIRLPRDPRSVLVDDHDTAFVSHVVGAKMSTVDLGKIDSAPSVVDLAAQKSSPSSNLSDMVAKRTGSQGYAIVSVALKAKAEGQETRRLLAPMVSVDPGELTRSSSVYYGPPFDGIPKEAPFVSVVDPDTKQMLVKHVLGTTETALTRECLLPHAAAVRDKTHRMLVACYGIDALLELDAWALDPFRSELRRFDVPPGPEGVAVDDASGRAVVFSQLGGAVTVIDLDAKDAAGARASIDLDYRPDSALAAVSRGRQLFYRTDDVRIAGDGLGCSSCHIDGRDDGNTWATPSGPRQTLMLAGRVEDTAPYGWEGERASLPDYIANTVVNLGGKGLQKAELEDLSAFLLALKGPPRSALPEDTELARRGRDIFYGAEQGCATCHVGGSTDSATHDFSSSFTGVRAAFDTPSLQFVRGTAPYFHDGRYATLDELLADLSSTMSHTASLPKDDHAALAAYLRSL